MKLIVCDIDGTLINSPEQKQPSERLIHAIKAVAGEYLVACATGRSLSWSKPVLDAIGFTAPCILGGGTYIVDPITQAIVWQMPLPASQLQNIKAILKPYPDIRILFNDYSETDYINQGWELDRLLAADEVFLMEAISLGDELAAELEQQVLAIPGVTVIKMKSFRRGVTDLHILNEQATKEHAVGQLQQITGVSMAETTGIGDGPNDLHIFNAVGTKIAMGNAVDELKQLADMVIGDVADDAVAEYLEGLAV